ncbi:hypothetical protein ASC94_05910 [Massilia sp. Root418]|nr:hypothetical protein ASC94_05910 [Massilia sp. Root418]
MDGCWSGTAMRQPGLARSWQLARQQERQRRWRQARLAWRLPSWEQQAFSAQPVFSLPVWRRLALARLQRPAQLLLAQQGRLLAWQLPAWQLP